MFHEGRGPVVFPVHGLPGAEASVQRNPPVPDPEGSGDVGDPRHSS